MSRTRATLATAAVGTLLLSFGAAASAASSPKCSKTGGNVVHQVDQAAGAVPVAGPTAESLVHDVVEPVACSLPV